MRFLYNNVAALLVALAASSFTWLFGGTRSDWLTPAVPWIVLFMAEAAIAFPERQENESVYDARARVWRAFRNDAFVWVAVALIALLAVPFVNVGLCPSCDAARIAAGACAKPPFPYLPFCVNVQQHFTVFCWFVSALACAAVARNALCGHGKRLVASLLVWNGCLLAVLGFVQIATGAEGPYWISMIPEPKLGSFFATWGYPNMAGCYFTMLFALAVGLWRHALDRETAAGKAQHRVMTAHRVFWRKHAYLLPAFVFFAAAMVTLSRAAIIITAFLTLVFFLHAFISLSYKLTRASRFRRGTAAVLMTALIAFSVAAFMPEPVHREVDTLDADVVLSRLAGKGEYHARVATSIWRDHLPFGCGGWGYNHFCSAKMTDNERKFLAYKGTCNVHNDWLQFLAEHGLVGLILIVGALALLLAPTFVGWKRIYNEARFIRDRKRPPHPIAIFSLPAGAFCLLLSTLTTTVHSFGDCPLRSAAVLVLYILIPAIMTGFLPEGALPVDEDED